MIDDSLPLFNSIKLNNSSSILCNVSFSLKWVPNTELSIDSLEQILSDISNRNKYKDYEFSIDFNLVYTETQKEIINNGLFIINTHKNYEEESLLGAIDNFRDYDDNEEPPTAQPIFLKPFKYTTL
ncbi:hypothetical protein DICPUDRAFT_74508 [Dictyostelium purpureum]|uniref:Uncharacterized protein n=1 Tax=Dictyostelium purpureum TaxID=5786 RepID=F0Z7Y3_DICPU|nr:uncharacterized protein DICPUDRAFT_74508 [Dictyostelium purpureum]EGC39925.1 hypothetical protein DICPUDRAFT_74508 [Dictyostelium purpureum]|eukprot:XP_003283554.1 hypothetical protein DICPUDRAFT_74508 [Dictyostelium purpureum]